MKKYIVTVNGVKYEVVVENADPDGRVFINTSGCNALAKLYGVGIEIEFEASSMRVPKLLIPNPMSMAV